MLFMLNIDVNIPGDMPQKDKDELRTRENARALELIRDKKIRRIWRIVGQTANYSIWEADSLEALHADIGSMPMFPFMKINVTPLIAHPATEAWTKANGAMPPF